jgi:hypothetical protein
VSESKRYKVKNTSLGPWVIVTAEDKNAARIAADKAWREHIVSKHYPDALSPERGTAVWVQELPDQGTLTDEQIAAIADDMGEAFSDAAYPYGDEGAGYDHDDAVRSMIAKGYKIIPPNGITTEVEDYRKRVIASLRQNAVNLGYEGASAQYISGVEGSADRIEEELV